METAIEHLARRVGEERTRAEQAIKPAEYRAHLLLAHEYERRLIAINRRASPSASVVQGINLG